MDNYTDTMFKRFELYFPAVAADASTCYLNNVRELTVILNNGKRIMYDDRTNSIRIFSKEKTYSERDEEYYRKFFSRKLKDKLYAHFMTQLDLSEKTGISKNTISAYANGKATPSAYNISKISTAFNCSPSDFFFYE